MITQINIRFAAILLQLVRHVQDRNRARTEAEMAYLIGVTPETLRSYRLQGRIEFLLLPGNDVRYLWRHYEKFLADCEQAAENKLKATRLVKAAKGN